uniref:NADH-ubiquinone oxidoreductase chain 2 n=1 Tax=Timema californicum TaxID=61474 RepID=Q2Q1I2_TIMCA|nr:NADH dehydrogenase subunit 2 [Timema californicum]
MQMNFMSIIFLITLMIGTLISISSNSWLGVWMGLEINLLSFIPLISSTNNLLSSESALKYFLIQAIASVILILSIILMLSIKSMTVQIYMNTLPLMLILSALMAKSGVAPLHFWFPEVMEGLTWMNCLILMTWQKIAPLLIMSHNMFMGEFTFMVVTSSIVVGALGGLNQTSMRKILAYSSIGHLGWMLIALMESEYISTFYLSIYLMITSAVVLILYMKSINHINQTFGNLNLSPMMKLALFINLLSLGGLPPFLGFLPKWLVIQYLLSQNQMPLLIIMVMGTLVTLFYYMTVSYSSLMINSLQLKWNLLTSNNTFKTSMMLITSMSLMGLPLATCIINLK